MAEEFEYTVETRYRVNQRDDAGDMPVEPNWGPWSKWAERHSYRTYRTMAGAAMACSYLDRGVQRYYSGNKAPYQETQARVSYRKVPKGWIPLLPELSDDE